MKNKLNEHVRRAASGETALVTDRDRIVAGLVPLACAAALILGAARAAWAQEDGQPTDPAQRMRWYDAHRALVKRSPYAEQRWQFLGPTNISGRVTDVDLPRPRGGSYAIYVATASGGVWKSSNEGTSWKPIFEHGPSTSVGDVTLAPSDPRIVWIGLGEANIFRSSMAGAGLYKSIDGGASWKHMGLAGTHTIARIVIHPRDPDIVYVAASGHEWTANEERGVYRSTNGGKSWKKVLFVDANTGAIDLVMDPSEPKTLYAATWQRTRRLWNDPRNEPGTRGSAIYRTRDSGRSWKKIVTGLPRAEYRGRIGIDVARSDPRILYAFVDNYEVDKEGPVSKRDAYGRVRKGAIKGAQVYRSEDRGDHWRKVSANNRAMRSLSNTYGWVFGQIRVDPTDAQKIYVLGIGLNVSEDGGKTFRRLGGMHGDHHALWIDPDNPDYLVDGNDGGLAISYDGGRAWRTFAEEIPVAQFYNVACDMEEPFHVYGSIQDHGSRRGTVDLSRGRDRIPAGEWTWAPGGEGSRHAVDPSDSQTVYSCGFYGRITRTRMATRKRTAIAPAPAEGDQPLRGQWLAPVILSPHNPRILYLGMNCLYRSMNRGEHFERLSPDLSCADPDRMGDIPFQTIFAISESPMRFGLIYAGTDDGRAHCSPDSGHSWREISSGLAPRRWIAGIEASRFDLDTVYLAQNGKRHDDFAPYLWKSTDRGRTWRSIVGNLPCGPINVVREDPRDASVLYIGTDLGVYVSVDGGGRWEALCAGLPTTFVQDLLVHPRDDILVAATHGRGMYALDVRPIQSRAKNRPIRRESGDFCRVPVSSFPGRWEGGGGAFVQGRVAGKSARAGVFPASLQRR